MRFGHKYEMQNYEKTSEFWAKKSKLWEKTMIIRDKKS